MTAYGGRGSLLIGVAVAETTVGTLLVGLRVWDARKKMSKVKWSLGWAFLAWLIGFIGLFIYIPAVFQGAGNHITNLTYPNIVNVLRYLYVGLAVGVFGTAISKFAIIALLLGVATPQQKKRRALLWTLAGLTAAVSVAQVSILLTQCSPMDKLWNLTKPGTCKGKTLGSNFSIFQGAFSALIDITIALYPITIVWNLQASLRVKLGFCALMAGGVICAVAASIRSFYIAELRAPKDATYMMAPFIIWCFTEAWMAIILGSIPPLRPLFLRWFHGIQEITTGKTGSRTTNMRATAMSEKNGTMVGRNSARVEATMRDDISEEERAASSHSDKDNGITVSHAVEVKVDGDENV